jgi:hypothetical protein
VTRIDRAERAARAMFRRAGFMVESVWWLRRGPGNPFAVLVIPVNQDTGEIWNGPGGYGRALLLLTEPNCPLVVTDEHTGRSDHRIYVAFPEGEHKP